MTLIVALLRYNDFIAAICGILLNLLLLYLVLTVKKTKMEQITVLLLKKCFLDLFLAFTTLFAGIQVTVIHAICYLIVGSPLYVIGFKAASAIMCTYGASLILVILALPVPFYIRYNIICKNRQITNKHVLIPSFIVLLCYLIIYGSLFWTYPPSAAHYEQFRPATMTQFWLSEYPEGPVFVAAETQSLSMLIPLSFIFLTTFTSYALVVYFSTKITKKLKEHVALFPGTKVMHNQLNFTLIVQALGPFLTGNLPVICLLVMIVFNFESSYPLLCCSFLLGWVSSVSPLAAIIIIAPYRRRVKQLLHFTSLTASISNPAAATRPKINNQWCQPEN